MKSLNDVITGIEHCIESECGGCPYNEMATGCGIDGDVLEHLKQYRMMLDRTENEPLSLPEIEWAQGCPVWLEVDCGFLEYSGWAIIAQLHGISEGIRFVYAPREHNYEFMQCYLPKDIHGSKWNVYRKEKIKENSESK